MGGGLAVIAVEVSCPDLVNALWNRTWYSHEGRLINSSQYRHNVPIVSSRNPLDKHRSTIVSGAMQTGEGKDLIRIAEATASNIVVIDGEGRLLFEDYHAGPSADIAMLTNSMSMAKTLVALLVGIAIDKGAIQSVDQPIGDFLEEFDGDTRGRITIRHLLQMESGLESQDAGFPLSHLQAMYFGTGPDSRALAVPAVEDPGIRYDYNSVNSQILLILVERVLGDEFEALLSRFIWSPLGLDPGFCWRGSPTGDAKGFCCVFANARAWASIGRLFLDPLGKRQGPPLVVSHSWLEEMIQPSRNAPNYGYHLYLRETEEGKVPYALLVGNPQQLVAVFPTLGIAGVRVGNEDIRFSFDEFISAVVQLHASRRI